MSPMSIFTKVALLFASADAVRVARQRQRTEVAANRSYGKVDAVYTFGAPGTSTVPFTDGKSADGCFKGLRYWTNEGSQWGIPKVDAVAMITQVLGFSHAKMDASEVKSSPGTIKKCSNSVSNQPVGFPDIGAHDKTRYIGRVGSAGGAGANAANVGLALSYEGDLDEVRRVAGSFGWSLVASSLYNQEIGGEQVSHLLKSGGVCLLTFQGSASAEDWLANLEIDKVGFCGLAGQTHKGWRDILRKIVNTADWQNTIRPQLSQCGEVHVTGHSLGGAMSEMFSACVNSGGDLNANSADEDYMAMHF